MSIGLLILGLLLFVGLVVVHELGHFLVARRNGVEVEEFGIGFPPRAYSKKMKSGFEFSLNWLPLGGFVKLKGENDADKRHGSLGAASMWAKSKIMLAGVIMNLLTAFVLLFLVALFGLPKIIDNQFTVKSDQHIVKQEVLIAGVESGSPADQAGIRVQDQLMGIGAVGQGLEKVTTADNLPELTHKFAGQQVSVQVKHAGELRTVTTTLRSNADIEASKKTDNPKGYIGIVPTEYILQRYTWSAPVVALGFMKQITLLTLQGLGSAVSNLFQGNTAKASEQVSGPVGIFVILKQGSLLGVQFVIVILAIISLSLALMNALPIPALDGGRLFVMLLFRAIRRPLTKRTEELIHGSGFMLLMVLFVLITVVDVKRWIL